MRILISNDDGIEAPGLMALWDAVEDLGEIHVVAPDQTRSAAGHAITVRQPLWVRKVHVGQNSSRLGMSVSGSPADCVRLALSNLVPPPVDLVLSGINYGMNVGHHLFYSGTVAAAAEAAMFRVPAVAFSAASDTDPDWPRVGGYCRRILERILSVPLAPGDLINVNIPASGSGQSPRGVRVARQSKTQLRDVYRKTHSQDEAERWEIADWDFATEQTETDLVCVRKGYIALTPLHVDMTRHDEMESFSARDWDGILETPPGSEA
jgi:5'-nucleotidase